MLSMQPTDGAASRWIREPANLAALWCLVFAASSFYWALGGDFGQQTVGQGAREADNVTLLLWVTGLAKVLGAAVAWGLIAPWGRRLPRLVMAGVGSVAAVILLLHGLELWVGTSLMLAGLLTMQESLEDAAWWYVVLWGPWWVLGGLLFAWATLRFWRRGSVTGVREPGTGLGDGNNPHP